MNDRVPVILDTDIGSDIDDALALSYLLKQPSCELLGITTVTGDVGKRAALAEVLCRAVGRDDVPIHCGAADVLSGPGQPLVPQYEAIRSLPHRTDWPPDTAIDFMRREIFERPGEVTLITVGPLTNAALLFGRFPGLRRLLKAWVSMAGIFFGPVDHVEWNSVCDPLSTALSFATGRVPHTHVGLDVTLQCRLPVAEARARLQGPLLGLVARMAQVWFEERRSRDAIVLHDPLAAVLPFQPGLCQYEPGTVSVDPQTGATSFHAEAGGADRVARSVEAAMLLDEFFAVAGA